MTLSVEAIGRLPIHFTERLEKDRWAVGFILDRDRDYGRQQRARRTIQITYRLRVAALWRAANPLYKRRHVSVVPCFQRIRLFPRWQFYAAGTS